MIDANGNIIIPGFMGNLPEKMKVEYKSIKLKLKDQYNQFNIVRTASDVKK